MIELIENNLAVFVAIFSVFLSSLSPVLVKIIDHKNKIKIIKFKHSTLYKSNVIEEYLKVASSMCLAESYSSDYNIDKKYETSSKLIFLYVDQCHWDSIDEINQLLSKEKYIEVQSLLVALAKKLNEENLRKF